MKNFYALSAFLLLGMQPANAQRRVVDSTPPPPSQLVPPKPCLVKASDLPVYRSSSDSEITRMLLKEYIHTDASGKAEHCLVDYDDHGNVKSISDGGTTTKAFSYVYATNGRWSERIETAKSGDTSLESQTKEVRTFDDQDRVLSIDDYTYDTSKSDWILSRSRAYDYVHDGNVFNEQYSVIGHCVKDINWRKRSNESDVVYEDGFSTVWYEPLSSFVECRYSNYSKDELTINDKGFIMSHFQFDYSSQQWIVSDKSEYLVNTPKAGFYTELIFEAFYDDGNLKLCGKQEYSNNWYSPMINDGKPRQKSDYDINSDGSLAKTRTKFGEWTKFPTFNRYHELVEYYDGSMEPYSSDDYYDDEGNLLFENGVYVCEDGSYVVNDGLNDGSGRDENTLYTFYNAQGQETGKARRRNIGLLFVVSSSGSCSPDGCSSSSDVMGVEGVSYTDDVYEIYRDGEWKPWAGRHDVTENGKHAILDINENGYPLEVQVEEDGVIWEKRVCTYSDNGYVETDYQYDEDEKKLVKDDHTEVSVDSEGTITHLYHEYDREDGSVMGGGKTLIYKNGKIEDYDWNYNDGKFNDTPKIEGSHMSSTDADGVTTKTTRIWDGNAMVVSSQSRSWVDADGNAIEENYKSENGTLVKDSKTVSKTVECPRFDATEPSDPLKAIDTDASGNASSSLSSSSSQGQVTNWAKYSWDASANDWKLTSKSETLFEVDDDSFTETRTELSSDGNTVTNRRVIKRDGSNRVLESLSEQATSPTPNTASWNGDYKQVTTYEYEGDNLTRKAISHTDGKGTTTTETYQYIYESFTPSGIGNVANASSSLALVVNGRTVSAGYGKRVSLYSMDGRRVASGLGTVSAPVEGVYVVEVDGVKRKMVLK